MDRLDFASKLELSLPDTFINFFNEIMVFYDLVNGYRINGIRGMVGSSGLSIEVKFDDVVDINSLISYIHGKVTNKYSLQYICNVKHLGDSVINIMLY